MTREEAIDLIYRRSQHCKETAEAFEVLKEETCEDCISRQAVLDAIDAAAWAFCDYLIRNGRNDEQKPVSFFADKLREYVREELPSVNPQPKTGHWIEKDGFDGDVYYDCSECGESWTTIEGTPWDNEWNYCPNCGAKMVEPQERETWNGIHAQITAPKGTFERIVNDTDDDDDI